MHHSPPRLSLIARALRELAALLHWKSSPRPWHYPLLAALCLGVPVLAGSYGDHFGHGILAAMGAMVVMYLPQAGPERRLVTLMACALGFAACFALGVAAGGNISAAAAVLALVAGLATLASRRLPIAPPGNFFFILIAAVATTLPYSPASLLLEIGLVLAGALWAGLLAGAYLRLAAFVPPGEGAATLPYRLRGDLAVAVLTGLFIGGAYLLALAIGLDNPYWVPISCAAIMQGADLRAVWQRKMLRIAGTVPGMGLAWLILAQAYAPWQLALVIMALIFAIECLVVRNYGLAVIFITPLTVLFAEAAAQIPPHQLVMARLFDIVLGSLAGFVGGCIVHHERFARWARRADR